MVEIFTTDFLASAIELLYDRTIFLLNSGFTLVKSSAGSLKFMLAAKIAQEVAKDNTIIFFIAFPFDRVFSKCDYKALSPM